MNATFFLHGWWRTS
ncbi:trp operon leader peptide [Citrobacter freundii]